MRHALTARHVALATALTTALTFAAAASARAAQADTLEITGGAPSKSYVDGTDFREMTGSSAGDMTAPISAVDLSLPAGEPPNPSTSGCESADFAGFPAGDIALLRRGGCTFQIKVENAVAAGATGAIIFNDGPVFFGTLGQPASISSVAASYAVGEDLANGRHSGRTGITVRLITDGVVNQPPDCSGAVASPSALKADGKLQQVTLAGATDPEGDTLTYRITGVTQDEPTTGGWRNDLKTPDADGISAKQVRLRGERNPSLNGRVYRIHYTVSDDLGSCAGFATVGVAIRKAVAPIDDGDQASWSSFTGALAP